MVELLNMTENEILPVAAATLTPIAPTTPREAAKATKRGPRKRAPKACLQCRVRKVRCDVSFSGPPCRNCDLDQAGCTVPQRKPHRFKVPLYNLPSTNEDANTPPISDGVVDDRIRSSIHSTRREAKLPSSSDDAITVQGSPEHEPLQPTEVSSSLPSHPEEDSDCTNSPIGNLTSGGLSLVESKPPEPAVDGLSYMMDDQTCASEFPFILYPDLSQLSAPQLSLVRLQRCLELPPKLILDEFVRQYFLHVHPVVPFLDESHFWNLYSHKGASSNNKAKIPLVLFQAMLFSACSYVSLTIVQVLGFDTPRAASAQLYDRAKILHELGTGSSSLGSAQAALLLTFLPTSIGAGPTKPNSAWLETAVNYARSAQTDHILDTCGLLRDTKYQMGHANNLKRLWWCCILRDRTLSLGLHRSLQITQPCRLPETRDFEDQIGCSLIYDARTQKRLFSIFVRMMELCTVLGELLPLIFSPGSGLYATHQKGSSELAKLSECRVALQNWYLVTVKDFPFSREDDFQHQSVIIQTNLMYIYYYTATLSLSCRDVLGGVLAADKVRSNSYDTYEKSLQAQVAAIGIADRLRESLQLGIMRYFPVSVVAFIAMPLLMHILTHKLQAREKFSDQKITNQHRLNVLIQAMKQYRTQYHGVEKLSEVIRFAADMVNLERPLQPRGHIPDWADIVLCQPQQVFQLTLTLNVSLSESEPPNQAFQQYVKGAFEILPSLSGSTSWSTGYCIQELQGIDPSRFAAPTEVQEESPISLETSEDKKTTPTGTDNVPDGGESMDLSEKTRLVTRNGVSPEVLLPPGQIEHSHLDEPYQEGNMAHTALSPRLLSLPEDLIGMNWGEDSAYDCQLFDMLMDANVN